jgi:hypothetical protein
MTKTKYSRHLVTGEGNKATDCTTLQYLTTLRVMGTTHELAEFSK